jgi:transcriptional regulator with XRE-family HTH domain
MSKQAGSLEALPPIVSEALRQLGENLALSRVRRKESQRLWAKRLGVSVPTLIRMEQGEPSVAIGVYATALWLIGRSQALPALADPKEDQGALELDLRRASERRAVRSAASIRARLGRSSGTGTSKRSKP